MRGKNTPLAPSLVAFCVSAVNGYVQARYLTNYTYYDLSWFYDPRFLIGHVLFLLGMAINIHSDSILRSLRTPGETAYKIPHGELPSLQLYSTLIPGVCLLASTPSHSYHSSSPRVQEVCLTTCPVQITSVSPWNGLAMP